MSRQCEASWRAADESLVGRVVSCPAPGCGKPDVVVTRDSFQVPVFEPHMAADETAVAA